MYRLKSFILLILIIVLLKFHSASAQSHYELSETQDGILIGLGIPVAMLSFSLDLSVDSLSQNEINSARRENVNRFDRFATYFYSENAALWSDILVSACIAAPLTLLIPEKMQYDKGTILLMYAEAIVLGTSLPALSKGIIRRMRPYVYNSDVSLSKKLTPDAQKSFFSGHTSVAFTSMIFFSTVYHKYYPDSNWITVIWGSSIVLAASVGYLRIIAGSHFPTDVIVGALVGSAIGYIIPHIHEKSDSPSLNHINHIQTARPFIRFTFSLW